MLSSCERIFSIDQYPVPWHDVLPKLLGPVKYRLVAGHCQTRPLEWLGLISSHSQKFHFASREWQCALQSSLILASEQGYGILLAVDTPYAKTIVHTCNRFGLPWMGIRANPHGEVAHESSPHCCGTIFLLCQTMKHDRSDSKDIRIVDKAVAYLSHRLFALETRASGKVARLIKSRIAHKEFSDASTFIAIQRTPDRFAHRNATTDLLEQGAVGWLTSSMDTNSPSVIDAFPDRWPFTHQPLIQLKDLRSVFHKYLCHCTRARIGPWPDQSNEQFHDELIHSPWNKQPSPLNTLCRILEQQRLIATNLCRKGQIKTVCFSECPIDQLLAMRRFRAHLARWDWEPYGILIDRDWLSSRGARPVTYVNSKCDQLNEDEAFCQFVGKDSTSIDWRMEQEWRVAGDIRLAQIPATKAIVFVPSELEGRSIQFLSRWPIAITCSS